ncbi:hypothetical protein DXG01_011265, partial [Tephrocybe rancida]
MPPADNDHPGPAPDPKKPSVGKRFLGRLGVSESTKSPASNNPTTRSMENLTALDAKSTDKRFFGRFGGSQSTKSSLISSIPVIRSMDNLTALGASAAHLAANIGVATAPTVPEVAGSIQVVTSTHASFFTISHQALTLLTAMGTTPATNVDQGSPATPAAASSTSAINLDQRGSVTPTTAGPTSATNVSEHSFAPEVPNLVVSQNNPARNPASLTNDNQSAPPGPNVSRDQSKFKDGMNVALDGCLTALRIAKEASDWNPFLKAALGGVVAVIDLATTVSGNSQDMKDALVRIQGLLPILETSAKRLEGRKDDFGKGNNLMTFAITMQTELEKIQQMQLHGLFRRVLQGTKDVGTLLGIYKNINEALEQFKVTFLVAIEHDTSTIRL